MMFTCFYDVLVFIYIPFLDSKRNVPLWKIIKNESESEPPPALMLLCAVCLNYVVREIPLHQKQSGVYYLYCLGEGGGFELRISHLRNILIAFDNNTLQ